MRNTFIRKQTRLAIACALALGTTIAGAQVSRDEKPLVTDARGAPVMSGFGLCVRSSFGPAPQWTSGCQCPRAAVRPGAWRHGCPESCDTTSSRTA